MVMDCGACSIRQIASFACVFWEGMSEEEMGRVRDGFNLRRLFTPFHWQHPLDLFPAPRFSGGLPGVAFTRKETMAEAC
jgi:hypothetical protein